MNNHWGQKPWKQRSFCLDQQRKGYVGVSRFPERKKKSAYPKGMKKSYERWLARMVVSKDEYFFKLQLNTMTHNVSGKDMWIVFWIQLGFLTDDQQGTITNIINVRRLNQRTQQFDCRQLFLIPIYSNCGTDSLKKVCFVYGKKNCMKLWNQCVAHPGGGFVSV